MLAEIPARTWPRELAWSAACNGCPEILALALPRVYLGPQRSPLALDPGPAAAQLRATTGVEEPYFPCMELLLQHGVDPNVSAASATGAALHGGARGPERTARVRFAAMLLDHGAQLDVRDELLQSTPLGWACRWGREELVECS